MTQAALDPSAPPPAPPAPAVRRWAAKGGLAILDQGLISGSNFVMGILLARWLAPEDYGAYSLAFSVFLLLTIVYQAILLEPMMVFGGAAETDFLRGYLKTLVRLHCIIVAVLFGALALGAGAAHFWLHPKGFLPAIAGAAIAGPCVLAFWLVRRSFYLNFSISKATAGAVVYCILLVGGSLLLERQGWLSALSAFLVMALAALVTCLALIVLQLRTLPPGAAAPEPREIWRKHWGYGRWALASSVAGWVPAYIYYPLLGSFGGAAAAGELRALMNFVQPLAQFYAALSAVFLPYAARRRAVHPAGSAGIARSATLVFMGATVAYWLVILAFRGPVLHALYGAKYANLADLIPAIAIGSVLWSGTIGASVVLRAMEAPNTIFGAYCAAAAVSLGVGIPLSRMFGVPGAVWGMNISDAAALAVILVLLRKRIHGAG